MLLTPDIFAALMQRRIPHATDVAVAVSGGGDSMALAVLMQEWAKANNCKVIAFTVDHGLRKGSAKEALAVQKILSARGIAHEILTWQGDKPVTHIQEEARAARYRLLLDACRRHGISTLAVAHNLEDQIETFWMRLAHGSGLDGLGPMAYVREEAGVKIIRPLLHVARGDLREVCRKNKIDWVEDPSNSNEKFLRVKLRKFEELLAAEGLTPRRLSGVMYKLGDARDALQFVAASYFKSMATLHSEGYVSLKTAEWKTLPADLQRRLLALCLAPFHRGEYAIGFDAIENVWLDLLGQLGKEFSGRTLAACEIFTSGDDTIFCREYAAVEKPVSVAEGLVWDGRFRVSGYPAGAGTIGALGDEGLAQLRKDFAADGALLKRMEILPFKIKRSLPVIRRDNNILSLPSLSWVSPMAQGLSGGAAIFPPPVNIV